MLHRFFLGEVGVGERMLKRLLIIAALLATASCGESKSDTLGEFGHYRNVRAPWQERTDPLEGPGKFLAYDTWSDDKRATLSLGCSNNRFTTAVSINGAGAVTIVHCAPPVSVCRSFQLTVMDAPRA